MLRLSLWSMFSSPDALCLAVNHQSKFSEVADCNCCKPSSLPSKKILLWHSYRSSSEQPSPMRVLFLIIILLNQTTMQS